MRQKKVVIIGASSSGLFASYLLAWAGFPVCLYDAADELNYEPRTLIVTGEMTRVLGAMPEKALVNRIRRIELFSPGALASVALAEPDLIVERASLLRLLAVKAQEAGVRIVAGHRFVGFEGDGDELLVELHDVQSDRRVCEATDVLLGADGVLSGVAQVATQGDSRDTVAILQARVAMPPEAKADTVQVWFDRQDTRFFYWLIPESEEHAVVGLIAEDAEEASQSLGRFMDEHRLQATEYQAAPVPLYRPDAQLWARVGGGDVFLVGDAAGQVKVTTVGGMVAGLRGARAVTQAIIRGTGYGQELRKLRRELNLHHLIRNVLDRFTDADYDELLRLVTPEAGAILGMRNRDEMARAFWRLLLAQPRWLSLAARVFLRPRRTRARSVGGQDA